MAIYYFLYINNFLFQFDFFNLFIIFFLFLTSVDEKIFWRTKKNKVHNNYKKGIKIEKEDDEKIKRKEQKWRRNEEGIRKRYQSVISHNTNINRRQNLNCFLTLGSFSFHCFKKCPDTILLIMVRLGLSVHKDHCFFPLFTIMIH